MVEQSDSCKERIHTDPYTLDTIRYGQSRESPPVVGSAAVDIPGAIGARPQFQSGMSRGPAIGTPSADRRSYATGRSKDGCDETAPRPEDEVRRADDDAVGARQSIFASTVACKSGLDRAGGADGAQTALSLNCGPPTPRQICWAHSSRARAVSLTLRSACVRACV